MLNYIRSYCSFHVQAALHSLNLLAQKPISTTMTVMVIALALALPALFLVFTDALSDMTDGWRHGGHISLYLDASLPVKKQRQLLHDVGVMPGIGQVSLQTPEQGLKELTKQEGMHDIMNYLPNNPLPPVIEVTPEFSLNSPTQMDTLYRKLQALPGVEEAKLDKEWINRLHAIVRFLSKTARALLLLLAAAVVFIIGNTMRLAIHSRQEEIQVLKLIGAKDRYIVRPFLYSGVWYGLLGAALAVILVNIFILSLGLVANQLAAAYQMHYPLSNLSLSQILLLTLFAIILGWLGACLSVKRQLASIEPYS